MADQERPCCGGSTAVVHNAVFEEQPHAAVVASYGLCLTYDEFIENKAIWVVDLKDGIRVFQDDDRPGLDIPSAWKRLGIYAQDHPGNPIVKMRLRFRSNIIELPSNQPLYFYSRGLLQAVTQSVGLDFHIVGGLNDEGSLTLMWYKCPELVVAQQAVRPPEECLPEQIIGAAPKA